MPTAPSYIDNTPSTIIYTQWSSRHEVLGCHPPMGTTWKPGQIFGLSRMLLNDFSLFIFDIIKGMGQMTPILLDRTIKGSHFLHEISKLRLFTRAPPVVHSWDQWGTDLPGWCVTCQRRSGRKKEKGKKNLHPKMIKTNQQVKHCIWMKNIYFL